MKKEKRLFFAAKIIALVLLVMLPVGIYAFYNYFFPMAAPLDCPKGDEIASIVLSENGDETVTLDASEFETMLQCLCDVKPTRQWSVQDVPTAENYYTVEITTAERSYRYFVYEVSPLVYVEKPYEGVYRADEEMLTLVSAYFGD